MLRAPSYDADSITYKTEVSPNPRLGLTDLEKHVTDDRDDPFVFKTIQKDPETSFDLGCCWFGSR